MRTKQPAAPFSHAEFELLPNAVQRKYFSSLERLRLAEEHSLQQQNHPHHQHRRRQPSATFSPRSSRPSSSSAPHRSLTLGSARRRLRKPESLRQEYDISQAEAHFFLSLPEKVRKRHFSREEQVLLASRCDNPFILGTQLSSREKKHLDDFQFDFFDDSESTPSRGRSRRRSSSVSPSRDPSRPAEEVDKDDSLNSLIYLDKMSPPMSQQTLPHSTPFRRTLSLTSMSFRHSTSSAPTVASPPLFSLGPQPWRPRASSQTQSGRRSSHTPTTPVFDPEATHYQDPEARKKLRMYLSSAQKFDEAVEFGFPSVAGKDETVPRYQLPPITTDARNFSKDMQTFLRDDKMSFLEEIDDSEIPPHSDGESVTDVESPVTPSSTGLSFRYHSPHVPSSNFSSMDSTGLPPVHPIHGRLNREMTLRMTLTRPDLRADEDQLYGWQALKGGKDDPFALEELHLSDDMTGAKGPFAVKPKQHGNLVTRLFKRASKKGSR
ncbi:uncharacterized protein BDR25DRAFT_266987 [Lindgomyces ingoldianus]|uniref:Uncharacterized protein n=1 Tax=Lindgomyces ingoldianus TaxID=673940 RepID=A0ACB6QMJ4_9PLEO|nr:uncharacterized protein BDR25DRAFT_266987 [Lindgomyces ingoldianus]KAF2467532.1 hypothetical protein BDR25DRAFT_266987 [Lindgomyces ingoldianus]